MRRVAQSLVKLYPASWRARYGDEFATLIEDSSAGWRALFDVMKGAIRMQLHIPAFPKLAVILSMLGLVTGLVVSLFVTPRYVSSAQMEVVDSRANVPGSGPRPSMPEYMTQLKEEILSRTSLSAIMQDPRLDLYAEKRLHEPLEDVIEGMRSDLQVSVRSLGSNYTGFAITFTYSDREKAKATVQALVTKFSDANVVRQRTLAQQNLQPRDQIDKIEARIAALEKKLGVTPSVTDTMELPTDSLVGINMNVIEVPTLPTDPVYPARGQFMAIGFGSGFGAATVIAVLRRRPPAIPFPVQTA